MKVILTEGTLHHLKTLEMEVAPQKGDELVVENRRWIVTEVAHFPKENGLNENVDCYGYDPDRDADLSVHLEPVNSGI